MDTLLTPSADASNQPASQHSGAESNKEKYNLAKAYIEMNDIDAAIPLLNELIEVNDDELSQAAANLLSEFEKTK